MKNALTIKEWAEDDRPREKLVLKGKESLSDAELLAIIIGSGTRSESALDLSKKILSLSKNSLHDLGFKSIKELSEIKGIGPAKAISIIAALEIGKRRKMREVIEKDKITSSNDVYEIIYPLISDKQHEEFWVVYMNKANKIIDREQISSGGVSNTQVDVKLILKKALEKLATAMILCHNHPSGNLQPSESDISLTKKIISGAKLFDCMVYDHLIIGQNKYFSFADEGLMD